MKFTVGFIANKSRKHIFGLAHDCGMDFINTIKKDFNIENVSAKDIRIKKECPRWVKSEYLIEVDEKLVPQIPQFNSRSHTQVIVPEGFIGKYYGPTLLTYRDPREKPSWLARVFKNKKQHVEYIVAFDVDYENLILDWIKAGCPDFWETNEDHDIYYSKKKYKMILNSGEEFEFKNCRSINDAIDQLIGSLKYGEKSSLDFYQEQHTSWYTVVSSIKSIVLQNEEPDEENNAN